MKHGLLAALLLWSLVTIAAPQGATSDDAWIADAYHRSLAYERVQKYADAIKALTAVRERFPETYTVNLRLGWLNYLAGHHANARQHYRAAIKAVPASLEARLGLLLPLLAQHEYAQAEQVATQILRTDLYNYYGNLRLLMALKGQKKYPAARTVAERMLAVYPADVRFLAELAALHALEGHTEQASHLYRAVFILDPENPAARRHLKLDTP